MSSKPSDFTRLLAIYRERGNFYEVFQNSLEEFASTFDFSSFQVCISFGTGTGKCEISFIERCLPNVRSFHAVEPDKEATVQLKQDLASRLPQVKSVVYEDELQDFTIPDEPIDLVLLFLVLHMVPQEDRKAFLDILCNKVLQPEGIVVVISPLPRDDTNSSKISQRFSSNLMSSTEVEQEMVAAGFQVVCNNTSFFDLIDLENPSEDILRFFQSFVGSQVSLERIAKSIQERADAKEKIGYTWQVLRKQ